MHDAYICLYAYLFVEAAALPEGTRYIKHIAKNVKCDELGRVCFPQQGQLTIRLSVIFSKYTTLTEKVTKNILY